MTLLNIAQLGDPIIRAETTTVSAQQLATSDIQTLIDNMIETMRAADGVGIAAPQVHAAKKIIIIEVSADNPRYPQQEAVPLTVVVNPVLISKSASMESAWEGCLSVAGRRGLVPRATSVTLSGLDRYGQALEINAQGFFARVIQHEMDHLDGHVFLDRATDLKRLTEAREQHRDF